MFKKNFFILKSNKTIKKTIKQIIEKIYYYMKIIIKNFSQIP